MSKITLEELKEIAKAGYGKSGLSIVIDKSEYITEIDSEYTLLDKNRQPVFTMFFTKNHVSFDEMFFFNHLAAIKKMRDLGLIEID